MVLPDSLFCLIFLSPSFCGVESRAVTQIDASEQHPSEPQIILGHEIIGSAGPDKREIDGIQRALAWLKERRSPDYGWENDTHMVILAKEVCSI